MSGERKVFNERGSIMRLMCEYVRNWKHVEERGGAEFVSVGLLCVPPKAINLQLQQFYRVWQELILWGWGWRVASSFTLFSYLDFVLFYSGINTIICGILFAHLQSLQIYYIQSYHREGQLISLSIIFQMNGYKNPDIEVIIVLAQLHT